MSSKSASNSIVTPAIEWRSFLARHDMVYEQLPTSWEEAPWFGNGHIGSMLYRDGESNRLRLHVFRSDVQDHKPFTQGHSGFTRSRLQIGSFYLNTVGEITGGTWRLDLYRATLQGRITTTKGAIELDHFVHAVEPVIDTRINTTGEEDGCTWTWEPAVARTTRKGCPSSEEELARTRQGYRSEFPSELYEPNLDAELSTAGMTSVCLQKLLPAGEHATAWQVIGAANEQRLLISIAKRWPAEPADSAALATANIEKALTADPQSWREAHEQWWIKYYQKSFVSLPDTRAETAYWTQIYKLASTTREDAPMMDTAGMWQTPSVWPFITWDMNVQVCYQPMTAANRSGIGLSLINSLTRWKENLVGNVRPVEWQSDSAYIGLNTGADLDQPRFVDRRWLACGGGANLTWSLHSAWLNYRHTMDDELLREKLYPLLRRSVNFTIHLLEERDGIYHLPELVSPEYGMAPDCNYELSSLRWGCETLLAVAERLAIDDALIPRWQEVLDKLVPFPVDREGSQFERDTPELPMTGEAPMTNDDAANDGRSPNDDAANDGTAKCPMTGSGYMVGTGEPFAKAHRHYSHLLMIFPYYQVNIEQPERHALIRQSIDHFYAMNAAAYEGDGSWEDFSAFSMAWLASAEAAMGNGKGALEYLNGLIDYKLIRANGLYAESGPVLESPLAIATVVHDMLLQSWGNTIRVFPAVPDAWHDIAYHDLSAEGGFSVSARREDDKTAWVRILSRAGEPCRVHPGMTGDLTLRHAGGEEETRTLEESEGTSLEIQLARGESLLIYPSDTRPDLSLAPIPAQDGKTNFYGLNPNRSAMQTNSGEMK